MTIKIDVDGDGTTDVELTAEQIGIIRRGIRGMIAKTAAVVTSVITSIMWFCTAWR
jgi:hypothetical protein